jgi:hypothetical protein
MLCLDRMSIFLPESHNHLLSSFAWMSIFLPESRRWLLLRLQLPCHMPALCTASQVVLGLVQAATVTVDHPAWPAPDPGEGPHGGWEPLEAATATVTEVVRPPGPAPGELRGGDCLLRVGVARRACPGHQQPRDAATAERAGRRW